MSCQGSLHVPIKLWAPCDKPVLPHSSGNRAMDALFPCLFISMSREDTLILPTHWNLHSSSFIWPQVLISQAMEVKPI